MSIIWPALGAVTHEINQPDRIVDMTHVTQSGGPTDVLIGSDFRFCSVSCWPHSRQS